jgi:type II restriction enzyme
MPESLGINYKSASQKARVITEAWMTREGYCPSCLSNLRPTPPNYKAIDYDCIKCRISFQLKSTKSKIGNKIPDGAYHTMISAIRNSTTPSLILMKYDTIKWTVNDLIFIPSFSLTEQAILPRNPLTPNAKRSGWIGCNIDISEISPKLRIPIVREGDIIPPTQVASEYARIQPLQNIRPEIRSWTLAVLNLLQKLGWQQFTTKDAYQFEKQLSAIFPHNKHIKPKIRQQLQVLRDLGIIDHPSRGEWIVSKSNSTSESI